MSLSNGDVRQELVAKAADPGEYSQHISAQRVASSQPRATAAVANVSNETTTCEGNDVAHTFRVLTTAYQWLQ